MKNSAVSLNESSSLLLQRAIEAGIYSPRELANILGNASVETAGFSTLHERFNYGSSARIIAVVNSAARRYSREEIDRAVASQDPERIAAILYENRHDLGNSMPGDGWRFHGRGYFQYTGRDNYARWGRHFGVDLIGNPEQAAEPEMAAKLAISYWQTKVPIESRENVQAAAEIINGGKNGMAARVSAADQWLLVISPKLVADIRQGHSVYQSHKELKGGPQPAGESTVARHVDHEHKSIRPSVAEIQNNLSKLGYRGLSDSVLRIDNSYGANTTHAIETFQRAHHLYVDGVVGKDTRAALEDAKRWPLLSEATHPQHRLYAQVEQGLRHLPGHPVRNDRELSNTAVALTIAAHAGGLREVDHVVLGSNGVNVFAVQGRLEDPGHRRVNVELAHAVAHAIDPRDLSLQRHPMPAHAPSLQWGPAGAPAMSGP